MERFFEKVPTDRRLARRHSLQMPIRLRMRGVELPDTKLKSENISQRGIFFSADLELARGATVDVLLEMPEEVTGVPTAHWLCTGRIVRVERKGPEGAAKGVAVQFDFYEVSRFDRPGWPVRVGLRGPVAPLMER